MEPQRPSHPAPDEDGGRQRRGLRTVLRSDGRNGYPIFAVSCAGSQCSAVTTVTGAALNYNLEPGFSLTYGWNLLTGPAPVVFATATSPSTAATFPVSGVYALQLNVNDGIATSSAVT